MKQTRQHMISNAVERSGKRKHPLILHKLRRAETQKTKLFHEQMCTCCLDLVMLHDTNHSVRAPAPPGREKFFQGVIYQENL